MHKLFYKRTGIILCVVLGISGSADRIAAQQVISTAGESFTSPSFGTISWTIGELLINTYSSGEIVLTEGIQQSNLLVTAISIPESAPFHLNVFPNPVTDFIHIQGDFSENESYSIRVVSSDGILVLKKEIISESQSLDFTHFMPGNYILIISDEKQSGAKYKIIKQ